MPHLNCDLAVYLRQNSKKLTGDTNDQMIIQIVKGLDYIHTDLELVHRDIKPLVYRVIKNFTITITRDRA